MRTTLCSSTCWGWRNVCGQKAQVRRKLTWNVGQFVKKEKHAFCLSLICLCTLHYLCYILDPLRNCFMHYFFGENYWSPNHVIGKNIGFCEEYTLAGHLCFLHVRRMIKMPCTTMLLANLPFKNKFQLKWEWLDILTKNTEWLDILTGHLGATEKLIGLIRKLSRNAILR